MSGPTAVLDRCLDWLREHLQWFGPATWNRHLPPLEIPTQTVVELLLLERVLARGRYAQRTRDLADGARALASQQVADPAFLTALGRADAGFPYLAWVVGLLGDGPGPLAAARRRAQLVVDSYGEGLRSLVWAPFNRVELDYVCWLGGLRAPADGFAEHRGRCGYARRDLLAIDEPEAYGVTHELFYATDLGGRPLPGGPAAVADAVPVVRTLLAVALVEGQLDLTAELVHCLLALGDVAPGDRLVEAAWQRLAEGQLPSGAVPGPPYSPALLDQADSREKRTALAFRTCYHTTLVAAMAGAAALAVPPGEVPAVPVADPLLPGRVVVAVRERRLEEAAELALGLDDGHSGRHRIVAGVARQLLVNDCSGPAVRRLLASGTAS